MQSRFLLYNATISSYSSHPWQIWLEVKPSLDKYIFYYADNVLQMRKSQIDVKLDQEQRRKAKKLAIEVSLQELVKQDEVEDSIQEPYSANKPEELDFKSLHQAVCTPLYRRRLADITECFEYTSLAHTQHCLQNAEDNNNSQCDFPSDVDLSSAFPHAAMYPGIMTDFTLEDIALWKKIGKQTLTRQIDIVETETDVANINTLLQASVQNMLIIEALKSILTNSTLPDSSLSQLLDDIITAKADCKAITDHIHAVLLLNPLKHLVVEGIFDYVIRNIGRLYVIREDQLLLYVRGEGGVGKIRVIHVLEIGFTLLNRRNELMISAPTRYTAEGIRGSIVHTAFNISTDKAKSLCTNVNGICTY